MAVPRRAGRRCDQGNTTAPLRCCSAQFGNHWIKSFLEKKPQKIYRRLVPPSMWILHQHGNQLFHRWKTIHWFFYPASLQKLSFSILIFILSCINQFKSIDRTANMRIFFTKTGRERSTRKDNRELGLTQQDFWSNSEHAHGFSFLGCNPIQACLCIYWGSVLGPTMGTWSCGDCGCPFKDMEI